MMRLAQIWLVFAIALFSSCATFHQPAPGLEISLVNLQLREATVWETAVQFTVRLENENPEPLTVDGAVHKIYLNGSYIGQGLSNDKLEVPRLGSATQTFTAHLRNLSMAGRVRALIEGQRFDYKIESVLHRSPSGRRLRASNTGTLDLREFRPRP